MTVVNLNIKAANNAHYKAIYVDYGETVDQTIAKFKRRNALPDLMGKNVVSGSFRKNLIAPSFELERSKTWFQNGVKDGDYVVFECEIALSVELSE